ncbi:MAG: sel1 repeat family protein [Vicinamibacteria bacterium]|nr:sel1 repeat family protein [Vicinamibacteria bacterium]
MKRLHRVLFSAVLACSIGCVSAQSFRSGSGTIYPPTNPDSVLVFYGEAEVKRPYEIVGEISTAGSSLYGKGEGALIKKARVKAAEMGANAILVRPFEEPNNTKKVVAAFFGTNDNKQRMTAIRFTGLAMAAKPRAQEVAVAKQSPELPLAEAMANGLGISVGDAQTKILAAQPNEVEAWMKLFNLEPNNEAPAIAPVRPTPKERAEAIPQETTKHQSDRPEVSPQQVFRASPEPQESAEAQFNRGNTYYSGQGVAQSSATAAEWFLKAADRGLVRAQFTLALMKRDGNGVPKDLVEALKWTTLASTQDPQYVGLRDAIAGQMTSRQLVEAQRLAREWMEAYREAEEVTRVETPGRDLRA